MNSPIRIGLVRYRKKPACRPFSMSRGMALALRATTGISRRGRVFAKNPERSQMPPDAWKIDVHKDYVRLVGTRELDPKVSVSGAQQKQIAAARYQLLDQLQVRRIVLYMKRGGAHCLVGPHPRPFFGQRRPARPSNSSRGSAGRIQFEPEDAPRAHRCSLAPIIAAHQFNQPLAYHQPDAGAPQLRFVPVPGG